MFFNRIAPNETANVSIFLPVIAVNSLIALHCERIAVRNNFKTTLVDAVSASVGYVFIIFLLGLLREIIGLPLSASFIASEVMSIKLLPFSKAQSICWSKLSPADCNELFILPANKTIAVTITPKTTTRTTVYSIPSRPLLSISLFLALINISFILLITSPLFLFAVTYRLQPDIILVSQARSQYSHKLSYPRR